MSEHQRVWRMVRSQLLRLGLVAFIKRSPFHNTAYACGTLVAGSDPATSVVSADGRVQRLDNLYVADGSALPRSGRVNPALTIYAWALRVADLLRDATDRSRDLFGYEAVEGRRLAAPTPPSTYRQSTRGASFSVSQGVPVPDVA